MFTRSLFQLVPAVMVTALLALAAAAPQAPQMPAPPPYAAPPCTVYAHTGGGDSVCSFANGDGVQQPLPAGFTTGTAQVTWSGAVGPVRFEVLDARGRRVATREDGAAGTWQWSTRGAHGEPLPSGVYFVHARDSAGGHVVQRLVIYH